MNRKLKEKKQKIKTIQKTYEKPEDKRTKDVKLFK